MRQTILAITVWSIAGAVVLAAALFARSAPNAEPIFQARCAACHTLPDLAGRIGAIPVNERQGFLNQLLTRHFPPPQDERLVLVQFLMMNAAAK